MIEIPNKAYLAKTYFPRTTSGVSSTYLLKLESELTQNIYHFSGLTDESKSKNYYKFRFDASQLDDGEYNYYVIGEDDNAVLATGLLRIGEVQQDLPEQYNYNPFTDDESDNEIVQYYPHGNFKYRFQDKVFTVIENGEYLITPDEGYDAIAQVELTVDLPIDEYVESGFTAGYESGYTDGYQEGYQSGYTDGFEDGYESGFTVGYAEGYESGYTAGYQSGYTDGFADGYASGYTDGYQSGKTDGIAEQKAKLSAITVVENGVYEREDGYSAVTVDLPIDEYVQSGYTAGYSSGKTDGIDEQKSKLSAITVVENGVYTREDGYSAVTVNVPVGDYYSSGYTSGFTDGHTSGVTDGIDYQKSRLSAVTLDENGYYTRTDGYSAITVNVPVDDYFNSGYTSGYTAGHTSGVTDGIAEQKSKLISTAVTDNGTYTSEDGYSAFTVNVPVGDYYSSGYTSGKTDGINEQKAKLSAATFTSNGVYTKEDGYSAVTVSVPSDIHNQNKSFSATTNGEFTVHADTGYSGLGEVAIKVDVPVDDYYSSGYTSGYTDGHTSGVTDGVNEQKAKLSAATFTSNGVYTKEDGYSAVTVSVAQTGYTPADMAEAYASGVTSGVTLQKSKLITTAVTSNGTYSREDGYSEIVVNVSSGSIVNNQTKTVTVNENGFHEITYDYGYTGLENVTVNVAVPQTGYTPSDMEEAYQSGETHQKSLLSAITINENGTYTRENGYSAITVNVPTGSTINNQNKSVTISANTTTVVTFDNGYTGLGNVTINGDFDEQGWYQSGYTDGYESGFSSGETYQKNKLVSTAITSNGTYTRIDGYNQVIVNVPQTGSTGTFILTVNITSNSLAGLVNKASVTVSFLGSSTTQTYTGSALQFSIYPGVNYSVSYATSALGYTVPESVTGSSTWQGSTSIEGYYDYTVVSNSALTFDIVSAGTIYWKANNAYFTRNIRYSKNGGTWNLISSSSGGTAINVDAGDSLMFVGDNATYSSGSSYCNFFSANSNTLFSVKGNIMSLIDSTGFTTATTLTSAYTFDKLFEGCSAIIDISGLLLPATTLTKECYSNLFHGCYRITKAPVLPATVMAESCYSTMFDGCTSLTTAPALPATTLADNCYWGMFSSCSNLTAAPELPVTTLAYGCYTSMFSYCTSLTSAPVLPATTLATYCYYSMFYGCSNLYYIKCLATDISASNCTTNWVRNVKNTVGECTFVKHPNMTSWTRGDNGIPTNWTIEDAQ